MSSAPPSLFNSSSPSSSGLLGLRPPSYQVSLTGGIAPRAARDALRPKAEWAIRPDVDFAHVADGASPNVFDRGASFVRRVTLVAHLRDDFGFLRAARKLTRFFDRPAKRLLDVDMFAEFHSGQGDGGVHVIRSGDDDGIDVCLVFEHVAKVGIAPGFRQMLGLELDHQVHARLGLDGIKLSGLFAWRRRGWQLDALF